MAVLKRRRIGLGIAAAVAWMSLVRERPVLAQHEVEYQVKAEYLYNFVQFITWPATEWPSRDAPFRFCVVGSDPFGPLLERAVRGERVDGHPAMVEHPAVEARNQLQQCQVVFVSRAETPRSAAILEATASTGVLTVGESSDFLRAGGAVAFAIDGGRVRFDINPRAPHIKDLRLSSKLLRVARTIWRGDGTP